MMTRRKNELTDAELVRAVLGRAGKGPLKMTGRWKRILVLDGLLVSLSLTLRRHVDYRQAGDYLERALEQLRDGAGDFPRCPDETRDGSICKNSVSAAVVYEDPETKYVRFLFVCGVHVERHAGERPVVRFPLYRLKSIRSQRRLRRVSP